MEERDIMAVQLTAPTASPSPLYVGDLHPDVTEGQLLDAFSEFKSLTSVRICRDSSSGSSLCYGYVNFMSQQEGTLLLFDLRLIKKSILILHFGFLFLSFVFHNCVYVNEFVYVCLRNYTVLDRAWEDGLALGNP